MQDLTNLLFPALTSSLEKGYFCPVAHFNEWKMFLHPNAICSHSGYLSLWQFLFCLNV